MLNNSGMRLTNATSSREGVVISPAELYNATTLAIGDESAMNAESLGVVFSTYLLFSAAFLHVGSELRRERSCPVLATEQAASGRSGGRTLGGAIIQTGIISVLCMTNYGLRHST